MHRSIASLLLFCAISLVALRPALAVTIDTVPIGNPGNANDPATGNSFGGVAYSYSIGKYDVTVGQYTAFLNAVAANDTYSLYNTRMATDLNIAGISRSGSPGSYKYSVIGTPNRPITYVNWGDAARFCNWLQNGQPGLGGPAVPQNAASTEAGAYPLNGAIADAVLNAISRNANARWFIPSESEWDKAAFYDPAAGHYWNYATGTNTAPASAPPGNTPNTANIEDNVTHYEAVTPSTPYSSTQNYLTDVGAYSASPSPYGTFDQSGDVMQWNEAMLTDGAERGVRGGSWGGDANSSSASFQWKNNPSFETPYYGFRVATVPEPSTLALTVCGFLCVSVAAVRRRRIGGLI
jgi:formylglycine-generating enzyme required for sulfatase activity